MISIEECRKLEPELRLLSDEEVTAIRDSFYDIVELAFESKSDKGGSKNPTRVSPQNE